MTEPNEQPVEPVAASASGVPEDELDRLLRRCLRARPAPAPVPGLAWRATRLAPRRGEDRSPALAALRRHRRRARVASALAAVLVLAVVLAAGRQLARYSAQYQYTTSTHSGQTSAYTLTSSSTTSATSAALWIGGGMLLLALVALTLERAFASDGPVALPRLE